MATARELLEQVDALMRRNREEAANADVPVLTDVVTIGGRGPSAETATAANDVVNTPAPPSSAASDIVSTAAQPAIVSDAGPDVARWERMAEDIRIQVLQRIDMFTETALQAQLKGRLQPIVDRASAELVSAISEELGALLRSYVAEAIEREIDKWKHGA